MKNLYNTLSQLAIKSYPVKQAEQTNEEILNKYLVTQAQEKITNVSNSVKKMYPTDKKAGFAYWKQQLNVESIPDEAKEQYWEEFIKQHPEGKVGAKRELVDLTLAEVGLIHGLSQKEYFLRDKIQKSPEWAKTQLQPILGTVAATVVNSNYSKAQQVYLSNLDDRMLSFMRTNKFDADVPTESHTQDIIKLEQLNLLDTAKFENGRIGVYNSEGGFVPSSSIKSRDQLGFKNDFSAPSVEEQVLVNKLSPSVIRRAVETSLMVKRNQISTDDSYSEGIAEHYLSRGDYDVDNWNTAFSMLPTMDMNTKIQKGIQGEIASGRIKTDAHLAQTIHKAITIYGNLLPKEGDK